MPYSGKVEYARERKLRERNTTLYRTAHWPIWIGVFFLAPGPLTFELFSRGFGGGNFLWLSTVMAGTGVAGLRGQLPGVEPRPYILRFDEDRANPAYRRICYTFAWSAILSYTTLNWFSLAIASTMGRWYMKQIYRYAYPPLFATVLALGVAGRLPRVGVSTLGEGHERRYFYGSVWATVIAHPLLLTLWKTQKLNRQTSLLKLSVFTGALALTALAARRGLFPRTRPILPGESMVAD